MDVDENKDGSSEETPVTSQDNVKKPGTSHENVKKPGPNHDVKKDKRRDYSNSQSSCSSCSMREHETKDQKPALHLGTRKMRAEKKERKKRNVGRVEKRKKRKGRYKRRPVYTRARAPSEATEDSHYSDSPGGPRCKYCGHHCCMQRNKSRASRTKRSKRKKERAQRTGKTLKIMLSECNQIGSRCTMLSPLFIKSNETPQELSAQTEYVEITPQMIHHSVQELTMLRESVPSAAILSHLQNNYQVNPNIEEALDELAEKLFVANIIEIKTDPLRCKNWTVVGCIKNS